MVIEELPFLTLSGSGEPGGELFRRSIEALFSVAFQLKFLCKDREKDFSVASLEALWWTDTGTFTPDLPPDQWQWKLAIRVPEFVTEDEFREAREKAYGKKGNDLVLKSDIEVIPGGEFVQILHTGSYQSERETVEKIREFMRKNHLGEGKLFREIYLSDPGRTKEENLKTILRQSVIHRQR